VRASERERCNPIFFFPDTAHGRVEELSVRSKGVGQDAKRRPPSEAREGRAPRCSVAKSADESQLASVLLYEE
jgi:hypothetical protein